MARAPWSTRKKAVWLGFLLTGFIVLARLAELFEGASLRSQDFLFWWRGEIKPEAPVVIVAIDPESFNEMGGWPWPRTHHARLIRQLMKGKPRVIVFDVLFTEEASGRDGPAQDAALAAACRAAGNVILGAEVVHVVDRQYEYEELKPPHRQLRNAVYGMGLVNTPLDSDAFVRRAELFKTVQDKRHYSLAIEALRKYLGVGEGEINIGITGALEFGDRRIPLDSQGRMRINFAGPAKTFRTIPFYQVVQGLVDPSVFKDTIVLVGATAVDLHDVFHTPFSWSPARDDRLAVQMPGVEIHANTIETILFGRHIRTPPVLLQELLIVGLGLLVAAVSVRFPIWASLATAGGLMAGVSVLAIWLFVSRAVFLDFVYPLAAVGITFLGCTAYRASVEMREQRRVRATFARYVSPHVLNTVLSNPPELGGSRRVATVLFSDVRGFTSMSEKLDAHQVVEILNEYLTEMVDVVLAHDGTLDKFVGDAVMAVYGSPMEQPDHPLRAVSTAWHMHLRHIALKRKWVAEGKVPFEIGIGINTGELVAGNMGSPNRMEFTVIGDNVNLAARLESATKDLGAKIVISGATYALVKDYGEFKEHPPIRVKGKAEAVQAYELTDFKVEEAAKALKLDPRVLAAAEAAREGRLLASARARAS
jgi:adenylate cyclase